jgi:5-formyltetrahydrofolate cyclo-ligase
MSTESILTKSRIRIEVKSILHAITPTRLREKSAALQEKLYAMDCYKQAEVLFCYYAMEREVSTENIIRNSLDSGKQVYAPRIVGNSLVFHLIDPAGTNLKPNRYGIPEPDAELPLFDICDMGARTCLIIVPGLAFDRQKNRLGRGKGYYDRFLVRIKKAAARTCCVVGICFSEQLFPALPYVGNDVPMDMVMTDHEVIS